MQNRTFLVLLMPIFGEKLKTAPLKEIGCRSCEVHVVIRPEKALEFPILAGKSVSIAVKTFFFFFFETTCFWAEKTLEFPSFREIPYQFSDKLCDSDSRAMKISFALFLLFQKSPPPPLFQILAMRLVQCHSSLKIGDCSRRMREHNKGS